MHPIGEEDVEGPRRGIDPEESARVPGVAVGADGEEIAARAAVAGIEIESAGPPDGHVWWRLHTSQHTDYLGPKDRPASIEEHAAVLRQVMDRREEPRMSRHPAHPAGGRIMHHTA